MNKPIETRIKTLRNEKDIAQKELGLQLGLSEITIQNYERGTKYPNLKNAEKIADYFGVSIDWLCGRTEKREINK